MTVTAADILPEHDEQHNKTNGLKQIGAYFYPPDNRLALGIGLFLDTGLAVGDPFAQRFPLFCIFLSHGASLQFGKPRYKVI